MAARTEKEGSTRTRGGGKLGVRVLTLEGHGSRLRAGQAEEQRPRESRRDEPTCLAR